MGFQRRRGSGTSLWAVVALVVVAVGLLVGASTWGGDSGGGAGSGGGFSLPGFGDDDATGEPSDWAPAILATLDTSGPRDISGTADEVALATLATIIEQAPIAVTVTQSSGPVFDAATDLAGDLQAPIVVVEEAGAGVQADGGAPSSGEAAGSAPPGTATAPGPTPSVTAAGAIPSATAAGAGSASPSAAGATITAPAELLMAWETEHVVAVDGTPPAVDDLDGVTIHKVAVATASPTSNGSLASPSSAGASSTAPSSSGGTAPGAVTSEPTSADQEMSAAPLELLVPDEVRAMLDDAAAATVSDASTPATSTSAAAVSPAASGTAAPDARASGADGAGPTTSPPIVVRVDDQSHPLLRSDVVTTLGILDATVTPWSQDDPRRDDTLRSDLGGLGDDDAGGWVLAVADDDRPAPTDAPWAQRIVDAATAPELPGGGLVLFPDRVFVASYGNPIGPALGVLGERDVQGSIEYTEQLAADYEGLFGDVQVQPAFEIITSIASSGPEGGDYSRREDIELVTEWVDAATEAGLYVMLDLQPGRTDFLTQAKEIEELLIRPNVGLALDPEWRLEPDQVHLEQIGTVTTAEVNEVSAWLAELVREHNLPQKLLIIHNFRLSMLTNREDLVDHWELAEMIHIDGQGGQEAKDSTYEVITNAGPDWLWWGWKNFYDEDVPGIRSPEDTAVIQPQPHFISYQ